MTRFLVRSRKKAAFAAALVIGHEVALRGSGVIAAFGQAGTAGFRLQDLLNAIVGFRRGRDFRQLLTFNQHTDFIGIEHFAVEQS
jgi:hypothetical protein